MEPSANVMACSTAAYERTSDVAAIITERTSIWTSFSLASYMVSGSSCMTRPTARTHHACTFDLRTHNGAHRSFDFPISFGTHRSTCLAFSTDFISYVDSTTYIDYATDSFAKFPLPIPSHSTSITNESIDGFS